MKGMVSSRVWIAAACCLGTACGPDDTTRNLPGYEHTFARSRFNAGDVTTERDELGRHKVIGNVGTFSTQIVSGAVVAFPNVPFPDPAFGVYPGDFDTQNTAVRAYFMAAGLPDDQVAFVSANEAGFVTEQFALRGWWSILNRGYEGVPVQDSIATAAFDALGRASAEQVYWPAISDEVLRQVDRFREMLGDPLRRATYIAKLPASARDAVLVIRHTSWFWNGAFEAQACCRGTLLGSLCFDMVGQPVHLPDEEASKP